MSLAIPPAVLARTGARTTAGVPAEVRRLLAAGLIETVNLSEWLIVDQAALAAAVFPSLGLATLVAPALATLAALPTPTAPKRLASLGALLAHELPSDRAFDAATTGLLAHRSDTARCWALLALGARPGLLLTTRLARLRPGAADPNMGVREIAWMALRPHLAAARWPHRPRAVDQRRRPQHPPLRQRSHPPPRCLVRASSRAQNRPCPRAPTTRTAPRRHQQIRARLGRQLAQRRQQNPPRVGPRLVRSLDPRVPHARHRLHRPPRPAHSA
jgi:hypothetical protein